MLPRWGHLVAWVLAALLLATGTARAEYPWEYRLPLVGDVCVLRASEAWLDESRGLYELVVWRGGAGGDYRWTPLLVHIDRLAVRGSVIVGTNRGGYFLLDAEDAAKAGTGADVVRIIGTEDEWRAQLSKAGVKGPVELHTPDDLAARESDQVLRPWYYSTLRGLLGLSDLQWALVLQGIGLMVAFGVGLVARKTATCFRIAVLLGVAGGVVWLILGAELDVFACFVALVIVAVLGPGIYVTSAALGRGVRFAFRRAPRTAHGIDAH